jgi:hypothetical protein
MAQHFGDEARGKPIFRPALLIHRKDHPVPVRQTKARAGLGRDGKGVGYFIFHRAHKTHRPFGVKRTHHRRAFGDLHDTAHQGQPAVVGTGAEFGLAFRFQPYLYFVPVQRAAYKMGRYENIIRPFAVITFYESETLGRTDKRTRRR